jgi:hypothetical protein
MTPERGAPGIPEWAKEERAHDFAWIAEHRVSFWPRAKEHFSAYGRGVIVVDMSLEPDPNVGHPMFYIDSTQVEQTDDEDTKRLVRGYDPAREFVVMLIKAEGHTSTYRIQPIEKVQRGRPRRGR